MNATFAMLNLLNFAGEGLEQSGRREKPDRAKSADFVRVAGEPFPDRFPARGERGHAQHARDPRSDWISNARSASAQEVGRRARRSVLITVREGGMA